MNELLIDLQQEPKEETINEWLVLLLNQALSDRASDIHIEPDEDVVRVRFRIDGILHARYVFSKKLLPRLTNIIFHRAQVAVSDFNHTHDAHFVHVHEEHELDVRMAHMPSIYGSSIVLRLLYKSRALVGLSELGFCREDLEIIERSLRSPNGMTLLVGPTGCGKTTTLYAMLHYLKNETRKIVTIEDPVEMRSTLMTQVQVNPKRNLTFGHCARSFLRHDPDIIFIGEIRDRETAQEAIRSSMTGHKVFATLHANRPLDALYRFEDLGVSFSHIGSYVSTVMTQRLVRKLCPNCMKEELISDSNIAYEVGCSFCLSGYQGRAVIAEILHFDEQMQECLMANDVMAMRRLVKQKGLRTMEESAQQLINERITSKSEIQRVLG